MFRIRRYIFAGLVILLGVLAGCAPTHLIPLSTEGALRDPALVHGVLTNGFQYVLMENQTPRDRVSIHLSVSVGSVQETADEQGIAHYLEHMLFNGSDHFKPGDLIEYFQSIGMDFGADANASTSFFRTVYDLSLPKGDAEHLEDALLVIQDYATGALLLQSEIDRERGIILAEKRERDSVSYRTFKRQLAFELPDSLLARRMPIGLEPVIQAADRKLLKNFYDHWYRPNNMVLVMVGDMDAKEAERLIRQRFSTLSARKTVLGGSEPDLKWTPHKGVKTFYHYEPEAGNTEIRIERLSYTAFEPETLDSLKQELKKDIADAILQNRLSAMVKKQTADFSSASVYSGRFLNHVDAAALSADCDPGKWEPTLIQLDNTLRQGLQFGFHEKELERVKADLISGLDTAVRQAGTRKTPYLARSILANINGRRLFLSPEQRKQLLTPFVEGLTLDQVNQAFRESWQTDHWLVLVSGNADIDPGSHASAEDKIRHLFLENRKANVSGYEQIESKPFPYLSLPERNAAIVEKEENVKGLGITVIDLANGVRLNLKPTAFKKGEFSFKAAFGHGEASEPEDLPGLAGIARSTVNLSGLNAMDSDQLSEALAGRDVSIGFGISDNAFFLSGSASPNETELACQLIYAYLMDPGFRPEALSLSKTQYRQTYEGMERTPDGIMAIKGDRFLAEGSPYYGLPEPDMIDKFRLGDVKQWLLPYFNHAPIEVSVVGDFDPDVFVSHARAYLGSLADRNSSLLPELKPVRIGFPKGKTLTLNLETRIDKGMVRMAFLTDDFWDIRQTRRFSVLSRVLSERLRKTIRENLGAAYSPYVYNDPSLIHDGYGVLQIVVNVAPENTEAIHAEIRKIVTDVVTNGITQKEVDLVLKPIASHLAVLKQSNDYWLNSVLAGSLAHPERFDWARNIISDYASVKPGEVAALARAHLDLNASALILILPGK